MRLTFAFLSIIPAIIASASTPSLEQIAARLDSLSPYSAKVKYSVSLPAADDDIVYDISLYSSKSSADAPIDGDSYLIDWTLDRGDNPVAGFIAYDNGNHYRFSGDRLQEYHWTWDSIPFLSGGGVHLKAQFADLLPSLLADELRDFAIDTARYQMTVAGSDSPTIPLKIIGREIVKGFTAREITMTFDPVNYRPVSLLFENNPGSISEQSVSVGYSYDEDTPDNLPLDEQALIARYPDIFERYRQSNFRIENLPGSQLPSFSSPTPTGERYVYDRPQPLSAPTVIAVLDSSVASLGTTISDVRNAIASLPMAANIIWAFRDNDTDAIEEAVGQMRPGETTLFSARTLTRDCGITSFPSFIFLDRNAKVIATLTGYNNNLSEIVIQNMTLAR